MFLSMVLVKNIEFYLWNENCTVLYGNRDAQILTKYLHNVMITIITPDCQLFFRQQCILVVYDPLLVQVSSSVTYWAFSLAILFYQIGRHLNCCKLTIFTHFVLVLRVVAARVEWDGQVQTVDLFISGPTLELLQTPINRGRWEDRNSQVQLYCQSARHRGFVERENRGRHIGTFEEADEDEKLIDFLIKNLNLDQYVSKV